MPCVICFGAYNEQELLVFGCGYVTHQLCADRHIAYRISNNLAPSCPVCNAPGQSTGRVYLDIDDVDVEHFGINNRQIFEEIGNRNHIFTRQAEILRMVNELQQQVQRSAENIQAVIQQIQRDNRDDAESIIFPHLGIRASVNANGVLLSNYVPDPNADHNDEQGSDDDDEDDGLPDADVLNIIDLNLNVRVNAEAIVFERAEPRIYIEISSDEE